MTDKKRKGYSGNAISSASVPSVLLPGKTDSVSTRWPYAASHEGENPMAVQRWSFAAVLLLLSIGAATAMPARVITGLNVRAGETTAAPIIAVLPAGAIVEVSGCGDGWCRVHGYGGFASANYLQRGSFYAASPAYVYPAPSVIISEPAIRYRYGSWHRPDRWSRYWRQERREARRDRNRELRQERREDRRETRREQRIERRASRD